MKQRVASFVFVGASVGGTVGLIGIGEHMQTWPASRTLGTIGALALLGVIVALLFYVLWAARNSQAKLDEVVQQEAADYQFENHHPSSDSVNDLHHD